MSWLYMMMSLMQNPGGQSAHRHGEVTVLEDFFNSLACCCGSCTPGAGQAISPYPWHYPNDTSPFSIVANPSINLAF